MAKRVCCDSCGADTSHVSRLCTSCRPACTTDREWKVLVNKPRLVKAPLGAYSPRCRVREINHGDSDFFQGVADHRSDEVVQGQRRGGQQLVYSRAPSEEAIAPVFIDAPIEDWILGTDQGFGVSLEHEDGDTGGGRGRCWEMSAYTNAARHAAKCAESGRTRNVA